MYNLLLPSLTFLTVVGIGGALLLLRFSRRSAIQSRLEGLHGGVGSMDAGLASSQSPRLVGTVEQVGRIVSSAAPNKDLREKLAQAGYYDSAAPTIYVGAQMLLAISALGVFGPLVMGLDLTLTVRAGLIFAAVALFTLLPNVVVFVRRHRRRSEVRNQLPDAIDLLEICVSAGLGLDMAWNAVADEFRRVSPMLADEMSLVNLEINLGAPRAEALRHMAQRTGVEDISSLVATLIQSERFGTSVSQALRTYADAMRTERSQRAEEAAEKLMVKMMFPLVLFIFPVMFVVILGPALIRMAEVLFQNG